MATWATSRRATNGWPARRPAARRPDPPSPARWRPGGPFPDPGCVPGRPRWAAPRVPRCDSPRDWARRRGSGVVSPGRYRSPRRGPNGRCGRRCGGTRPITAPRIPGVQSLPDGPRRARVGPVARPRPLVCPRRVHAPQACPVRASPVRPRRSTRRWPAGRAGPRSQPDRRRRAARDCPPGRPLRGVAPATDSSPRSRGRWSRSRRARSAGPPVRCRP